MYEDLIELANKRLDARRHARTIEFQEEVRRLQIGVNDAGTRHYTATSFDLSRRGAEEVRNRINAAWAAVDAVLQATGSHYFGEALERSLELVAERTAKDSYDIYQQLQQLSLSHGIDLPTIERAYRDAIRELAELVELRLLRHDRAGLASLEELRAPRYDGSRHQWVKAHRFLIAPIPDPENAVKEAAGALEGLARIVADQPSATFGAIVRTLKANGRISAELAPVLERVWGYVSQLPGARHGADRLPTLSRTEAVFIVGVCESGIRLFLALDRPDRTIS